jgi:hypothetical protein
VKLNGLVLPNTGSTDCQRLSKKDGGRGRNRTFNLSIKSRMLCQLSYASLRDKRPNVGQHSERPSAHIFATPKKKYSIRRQVVRIAIVWQQFDAANLPPPTELFHKFILGIKK